MYRPWNKWSVRRRVSVRQVIEYRGQVVGFLDVIEEEGRTLLASIRITPNSNGAGSGRP
jgi:hypothetical protein